jgi:serine/threonine-protein kinase
MAEAELKTLGRYNIERVLGKGAMGVVYEGIDPKLNRRVAIKTILKSHLDPDTAKDYSMRFSREAQAVARLNHPHIVQVYDFAEEGDIAYLVMEFIRGKELKNFFDASERFDLKEAVRIMCELLDALDFAHNAGIIHRDIKPANVMLDAQARTKLTDFGVARVQDTDRTQAERTQAGTMVGTPAYMSPEQITGGTIDKRSDVFSAGIILYQFLTGEKPFTGGGAWTIAKKIIQEDPPAPSSLNNAVTPYFDSVVNKALSKNAETRYQSAKDFGVALRRALEGRGEEEDADKTIVGEMTAPSMRTAPQPRPSAAVGTGGTQTGTQAGNQEVELEFWRAIKDGNDPDDFDLYVQQFPNGIYSALAKRKIAKLRGAAPEETTAEARKQERKEAEEAARKEAEARARLAEEKEKLELELARKEEEFKQREAQREAEAVARAEAAEKAKQEAAAERERARLEAEKAKQEAAAELAKREAEYKKREAEAEAKRQAEAKARAEAEAKAKAEADAKAKQELAAERERARLEAEQAKKEAAAAAEKAKLEAEKAKKETEALAKKQAEERAKREAEFKKREAELKAQAAAGGKKTSPALLAGVAVAVLAIAGAGYYFFAPDDAAQKQKIAEMQKQLQMAQQQAATAEKAKKDAEAARLAADQARKAEEEARAKGDREAQKKATEERQRREEEAKKMAEASKQRDAEAKKTADAARAAQDKASAGDRQAAQKAEAERAAAERANAARTAQEKAAAEKAALERAAAAEKAAQERIAAAEKAAAEAAARAVAAEKAAAEKAKLAAAAPGGSEALFDQAMALEQQGKGNDAVKIYVRAARSGNGKAAKRLGEIYDKGLAGVSRDYAESLKWYNAARVLGEDVPMAKSR